VVFALDISKRKQAETLLHQERDMTAAVLDTAGALVVVLDRQGHIVRFNRACERTTGYSFEEVGGGGSGNSCRQRENLDMATFTDLLRATQVESRRENHWLTRDGRRRLIAWSNTYLFNTADT
jgi:PAS domain S-box-containing protein